MSKNLVQATGEKLGVASLSVLAGKIAHAITSAPTETKAYINQKSHAFITETFHCRPRNKDLMNIPAEKLIIELFCKSANLNKDANGINNTFTDRDKLLLKDLLNSLKLEDKSGFKAFTDEESKTMSHAIANGIAITAGTQLCGNILIDVVKDGKNMGKAINDTLQGKKLSESQQKIIDTEVLNLENFVISILGIYAGKYFLAKFLSKLSQEDNKNFNNLKSNIININNKILEEQMKLDNIEDEIEKTYERDVEIHSNDLYYDLQVRALMEYKEKMDEYNTANPDIKKRLTKPSLRTILFEIPYINGERVQNIPIKYNEETRKIVNSEGYKPVLDVIKDTYKRNNPKPNIDELKQSINNNITSLKTQHTKFLKQLEKLVENKNSAPNDTSNIMNAVNEDISSSSLQETNTTTKSFSGRGGSIKNSKKHKRRKTSKLMRLK